MRQFIHICFLLLAFHYTMGQVHPLVFQTDFGEKDGAVAAMKGVAFSVSPDLKMFDLTHEIPPYNIWEAAYRLHQAVPYWPAGTVFVSVVDPGVGSERRSVVMKSKSGHYFVTPDNGTLTLVAEALGIGEVRIIDEAVNRLRHSTESHTFHGRDVYAYTAARLASGSINYEQVGPLMTGDIVRIHYQKAGIANGLIKGNIDILDVQYGNVWTNVDMETFRKLKVEYGDAVSIKIFENDSLRYEGEMIYGRTFSDVPVGKPVAYMNSLLHFSVGVNEGNFAGVYGISSGPAWHIQIRKSNR